MPDFISELQWRGMIHDIIGGTQERLQKGSTCGYVGFDPTASSLHIGNLVTIMLLVHFQKAGHKPIALVGGATGMIGDPSGKSQERILLSIETLHHNQECISKQLHKFLDFSKGQTQAEIVNNYEWFKDIKLLEFLREIGKHLSINYMIAKDSVQARLQTGLSFTEFSYQLLQAYDFYWLYKNKGCELQMGGSDQWGNITSGTELIRRICGANVFALTCPLLTRDDGRKFGKSESGENIWLDPSMTSPYCFYQFWLNCSDEDSKKYIKIFTTMDKEQIDSIILEHNSAPHRRILQKRLAKEITILVHSKEAYESAVTASEVLFGEATRESLKKLSEKDLLSALDGVPQFHVARSLLEKGIGVIELLSNGIFSSKGEVRRMIQGGGVNLNKKKVDNDKLVITSDDLINNKYLLVQKGKKNYYLVVVD